MNKKVPTILGTLILVIISFTTFFFVYKYYKNIFLSEIEYKQIVSTQISDKKTESNKNEEKDINKIPKNEEVVEEILNENEPEQSLSSSNFIETVREQNGYIISFSGNAVISGQYSLTPDNDGIREVVDFFGGELKFFPDEKSQKILPLHSSLDYVKMFGFGNNDDALKMINLNKSKIFGDSNVNCIKGNAVIEIQDFSIDERGMATLGGWTILKKVISKENYKICNDLH